MSAGEKCCKPYIVGITGGSGSGKTYFAKRLSERLDGGAVVISHDDYYKNMPDMTDAEAAVYDFDSPDALDTWLLVEHLRALAGGLPVEGPSYDFATHVRTDGVRHIEPAPVVLVEGLLVMCDPELLGLFDLTIFIDVDADVRVVRRFERDCQSRGASLERAIQMYLGTAKPAYDRYVEPFKKQASIVITDASDASVLEFVAAGIANARS